MFVSWRFIIFCPHPLGDGNHDDNSLLDGGQILNSPCTYLTCVTCFDVFHHVHEVSAWVWAPDKKGARLEMSNSCAHARTRFGVC